MGLAAGLVYALLRRREKAAKRAEIEAAVKGSRRRQAPNAQPPIEQGALLPAPARPRGGPIGWYNGRPIWACVEVVFRGRRYQLPFLRVVHGFRMGSAARELGIKGTTVRWMRTTAGVIYGFDDEHKS